MECIMAQPMVTPWLYHSRLNQFPQQDRNRKEIILL